MNNFYLEGQGDSLVGGLVGGVLLGIILGLLFYWHITEDSLRRGSGKNKMTQGV